MTNSNSIFTFLIPDKKDIIYIDVGHGGFDGGCSINGVKEKDITLKISLKLRNYLTNHGYKVYLTRDKDISLASNKSDDIKKRVKLINKSNASTYVSIHVNSFPIASIKGAQVFFKESDNNELLAQSIQRSLQLLDNTNKRVAKEIKGKYLIDKVTKSGCLVEVGFLTNNEEFQKLIDDNYQSEVAYLIYLGIVQIEI